MTNDKQKMYKDIPKDIGKEELQSIKLHINKTNQTPSIKGVYFKKLDRHVDSRGDLTEIWSKPWAEHEPISNQVEHVYYNTTREGIVKGFHWHRYTFSQYTCVSGDMQVVLVDIRKWSETYGFVDQFIIGTNNPSYIKIPPGVLKAWKSLKGDSVIVNLLTSPDLSDNYKIPPDTLLNDIWL